ncbi:hypothetical protein COLO4_17506 [Corchorus olitorius]|uniref:Uncharacterized protein n=1 Tax=Corchorus olitorius TaxID=93759 RepID=A0A1R3JCE2_9ROSI|nr:hypothetical protein COLO4_17506 [Corchorus olitorius]
MEARIDEGTEIAEPGKGVSGLDGCHVEMRGNVNGARDGRFLDSPIGTNWQI